MKYVTAHHGLTLHSLRVFSLSREFPASLCDVLCLPFILLPSLFLKIYLTGQQ